MGFFSGPSKFVLHRMAQGVASYAMQIHLLKSLDHEARNAIVQGMKAEGAPTSMPELIAAAASVAAEQKMGWLKKNQFLGAIQAHLVILGMSHSDAAYLKGLIEIRMA